MGFEESCDEFIKFHRQLRTGQRQERLSGGLGHAETLFLRNVWWPVFHSFEDLHPEYEIRDYKEGYRYLDFAYIQPYFRLAIEIDGVSTHWRQISQEEFIDHNERQNMLLIDGWYLLRFTFESVKSHPRNCQQSLQQMFGRWQRNSRVVRQMSLEEREIVRFASRSTSPITPSNVSQLLDTSPSHARTLLHRLVEKRWMVPASGKIRHTSYRLDDSRVNIRW